MGVTTAVEPLQWELFPQGDERDPLGVWGFRQGFIGDGTGSVKAIVRVPAAKKAAYIYTVYGLTLVQLTGTPAAGTVAKSRILTNWPDVDPTAGVQAYATARYALLLGSVGSLSAPQFGPDRPLVEAIDRFILMYDPRSISGDMDIIELELSDNVLNATYSMEGWGYVWDRAVMAAPGGPRHPGAS